MTESMIREKHLISIEEYIKQVLIIEKMSFSCFRNKRLIKYKFCDLPFKSMSKKSLLLYIDFDFIARKHKKILI